MAPVPCSCNVNAHAPFRGGSLACSRDVNGVLGHFTLQFLNAILGKPQLRLVGWVQKNLGLL